MTQELTTKKSDTFACSLNIIEIEDEIVCDGGVCGTDWKPSRPFIYVKVEQKDEKESLEEGKNL